MPCSWIFADIIGDGKSTKIAKVMVVHWHLTFFRRGQVCFPMHAYGKNVELQMTSPLEPLYQCCSNFIWSLPGAGEWKIAKLVAVHWPRWQPCPYMVKTFKKFTSPEPRMPCGWNFAQIIRDGRSTKVAKMMVVHWHLTFYGEVKFASVCICMGPIHCMEKMLIISNDFSSEASGSVLLRFHVEPPWGRRMKVC